MARIVVGMSGGVDSSLTAALLQEAGHEVIGMTLILQPAAADEADEICTAASAIRTAGAVAEQLGIEHHVLDDQARFKRDVIDGFLDAYRHGQTPNPCVACNNAVKFEALVEGARRLGADAIASGHYGRTVQVAGRWFPAVAADPLKDQSYFLYRLSQAQLALARFPLGDYDKPTVRRLASERGLAAAERAESMDLCLLGRQDMGEFLREHLPDAFTPGPIVHTDGRTLGEHQGLVAFTIGQRKGLGVAAGKPAFVVHLDQATQTVVLGDADDLLTERQGIRELVWHAGALPADGVDCLIRPRHRATPRPARLLPGDAPDRAVITYEQPQPRTSPGQAAVAYDLGMTRVLGGGLFEAVPWVAG